MGKVSDEVVDFSNMSDEEKENFIVKCVNKICNVEESSSVCDWSTGGKTLHAPRSFNNGFIDNLNKKRSLKNLMGKKQSWMFWI